MIARMQTLKRKLQVLHEEEQAIQAHSQKRIRHLQDLYEIPSLADVKYDEWSRVRLDRLMVDYLLRAGYSKSAASLAKEKGIENLVDLDVFVQCQKVADSLERGETKDALMWCTENRTALKKIGQNNLEFELRLQQYIEMIRSGGPGKQFEAMLHAKKFLVPYKDTHNEAILHAAGLLAQPPNTSHDPYKVRLWTSNGSCKHADYFAEDVLTHPLDLSLEPVHHDPPHTTFPPDSTPPTYRP
jgi:macrophage erythroblast attacher